ncbi:MAG: alpha/beta hydrolase [Patescibacteria group bacterium]|nr:alpha/beta hydrolase [Patescibacteria group bacterium]
MRNIFLKKFLLLSLLTVLFAKNALAQEKFTKYENNPLSVSIPPNYLGLLQVNVFYHQNIFKGIFTLRNPSDKYELYYGESINGLNWSLIKKIETGGKDVSNPRLFQKNENQFVVYFASWENSSFSIYKINCDQNLDCEQTPTLVLSPEKHYEQKGVFAANHYFVNNQHYLFYGSWNNGFHINLAISNDGENWQRCSNNPLLNTYDGAALWQKDNQFYLFYHVYDSSGIKEARINHLDGCNIQIEELGYVLRPDKNYDQWHLIFPSLVEVNNNLYLFYSGNSPLGWTLNLATLEPIQPSPLPTYTPTPSPTSSPPPTITPTPTPKSPLILLPGLFASWNKKALVYNQTVEQENWRLNPIVNEYSGIIQTFKNLGLEENKDFYLFNYDWRKSIDNISDDFNQFLNKIKNNNQNAQIKFNLIGHSLGGLVARIYSQKYGTNNINQIITVGSPHQGTAQVYKVLEAGEIETPNNIQWLIFKLILQIYKDGLKTDKQIIQEKIPVVKDLLATYPLLKDQQNNIVPLDKMTIKNDLLLNYNQSFSQIFFYLYTLSGKNLNTPFGYQITPRTIFDQIMDYYPDGRPVNQYNDDGDGTVLLSSSQNGDNFINFNFNHGEIIYKKEPIKKILERLNLNYQENQINEGKATNVNPSLIITLLSPATLSLTLPDNSIINDQDGIILVENAQNGDYQLKVNGNENGQYKIIVGQITDNKDYWNTIENQTQNGKEESYLINFNINQPKEFFIDNDNPTKLKEIIINEINSINNPPNNNLNAAIKKLFNLKKSEELFIVHKYLFNSLNNLDKKHWSQLLAIINKLEYLYNLINKKPKIPINLLKIELKYYQLKLKLLEKILLLKKNQKNFLAYKLIFYQLATEKFEKAKQAYENKNYSLTEILLETIKELTIRIQRI